MGKRRPNVSANKLRGRVGHGRWIVSRNVMALPSVRQSTTLLPGTLEFDVIAKCKAGRGHAPIIAG